jgi:hypothetical protein
LAAIKKSNLAQNTPKTPALRAAWILASRASLFTYFMVHNLSSMLEFAHAEQSNF